MTQRTNHMCPIKISSNGFHKLFKRHIDIHAYYGCSYVDITSHMSDCSSMTDTGYRIDDVKLDYSSSVLFQQIVNTLLDEFENDEPQFLYLLFLFMFNVYDTDIGEIIDEMVKIKIYHNYGGDSAILNVSTSSILEREIDNDYVFFTIGVPRANLISSDFEKNIECDEAATAILLPPSYAGPLLLFDVDCDGESNEVSPLFRDCVKSKLNIHLPKNIVTIVLSYLDYTIVLTRMLEAMSDTPPIIPCVIRLDADDDSNHVLISLFESEEMQARFQLDPNSEEFSEIGGHMKSLLQHS
jgi:hypothetical protein